MRRALVLFALLLALLPAFAFADAPPQFRDTAEEARFRHLTEQLRCVMCQNQSLADSDAPIAHDLRRQVLEMIRAGRSDAQVKRYLVARYSEFVLYEPEVRPGTIALWAGPALLVLAGGVLIGAIVRRRAHALPAASASTDAAHPESVSESEEW
jgi:cytochrome c-type biogenesis protein CcmH